MHFVFFLFKNKQILYFKLQKKYFQIFEGNKDKDTVVIHQFGVPIKARWFRINPVEWHEYIALRFDFLVC